MIVKTAITKDWTGNAYKVFLNGKKYPKEISEFYHAPNEKTAIEWSMAEYQGKYLSSGGIVYNSKKEYLLYLDTIA